MRRRSARGSRDRFDLPVYLYARAASRPDRVRLADVRRGQYEGLRDEIGLPERAPDFGPPRMHPRGGALAVGARPFLVAWNVNLESRDLDLAKRIAAAVRESSGGLPAVQAQGFWIEELGCAQVSMNLLDTTRTPVWQVWEAVTAAAAAAGVEPRESELIGLAPLEAFLDVADHAGAPAGAARGAPARGGPLPPPARRIARHGARAAPARGRGGLSAVAVGHGRAVLIAGASEVATLAGGLRRGPGQDDPAVAPPGTAVACLDGRILDVGPVASARAALAAALEASGGSAIDIEEIDATGATVTPGLIDSHTHLLFGGSREAEIQLRQRGATYLEILAAGGGILSTVAATRAASDDARCSRTAADGSRRCTARARRPSRRSPATAWTWRPSCGSSASPRGSLPRDRSTCCRRSSARTPYPPRSGPSIRATRPAPPRRTLRRSSRPSSPPWRPRDAARFADVFCETGVFTPEQARRVLVAARRLGLAIRLHADELTPSGGAELGAELGACSVDHLAAPSPAGIAALAAAADAGRPVIATLLPTVGWFLGLPPTEPARELVAAGIPVALATDFNPGTSPIAGLPLVMTTAVLGLRMTPGEALAATTVNAAAALLLDDRGMLAPGMRADIVIWDVPTHAQIPYWVGAGLARTVISGRPATGAVAQPGDARAHAGAPTIGASAPARRTHMSEPLPTTGGRNPADLLAEESSLTLASLNELDAIAIGERILARATRDGLPVTIEVRRGARVVFRAALPGSSADNDAWIARKARVAERFGHSSLYVRVRYEAAGTTFEAATGLPAADYAPSGAPCRSSWPARARSAWRSCRGCPSSTTTTWSSPAFESISRRCGAEAGERTGVVADTDVALASGAGGSDG